jgi:hypothetical protein
LHTCPANIALRAAGGAKTPAQAALSAQHRLAGALHAVRTPRSEQDVFLDRLVRRAPTG